MIHESTDDEDLGKRAREECFLIVLLRIILATYKYTYKVLTALTYVRPYVVYVER